MTITGPNRSDELLLALADQLALRNTELHLVVVGGSALLALGLVSRPTRDVDVVALHADGLLQPAGVFPAALVEARDRVARDFGLSPDWLNAGPADLLDLGLPEGFAERLTTRRYGPALSVSFASRFDQIHLKLYAAVDAGGPGKHEQDLRALNPAREELVAAARWSRTHDPSQGYREMLVGALAHFGVEGVDLDA